MKLLWTISNWKHTGPVEPSLDLAAAMAARAHAVQVAVGRPPRGAAPEAQDCVTARGLALLRPGARLAKHSAPLRDLLDASRLRRAVRALRPDALVATLRSDHRLLLRARGTPPAVPLVRLWFGDGLQALDRRDVAALQAANGVVVFSDTARRALEAAGVDRKRILRTGPPLDLATLRGRAVDPAGVRARYGIAPGAFLFGIVARLQRHRRFEVLWEAVAALRRRGVPLHLLVVGRGTHQASVGHQPVAALGLADVVTFAGYLRGADYVRALAALDAQLFLVPGSDPTCRALREGMALGVPSVAMRRGMLPEIVADGETGVLVDDTAASLAAGMETLAADRARAQRQGQAARRRADEVFCAARVAADLEALLGALVRRP